MSMDYGALGRVGVRKTAGMRPGVRHGSDVTLRLQCLVSQKPSLNLEMEGREYIMAFGSSWRCEPVHSNVDYRPWAQYGPVSSTSLENISSPYFPSLYFPLLEF